MESVIGGIAIVFVTGMILWMNTHARGMKKALEAEAAEALSHGGVYALAGMAFLAVLREGFETSVFLLATFSAAQSAFLAAAGAIIGLAAAVAIGWGFYAGGVRIHLGRFFRITGAFLLLVAAGLAVTSLRTAHVAGWLNVGQQPTVDLSWLVAPGTIRSALITGVLGIPADPRVIEVIGWFAYLIPVAALIYWPPSRRPGPRAAARLKYGVAAALLFAAFVLAVAFPAPEGPKPAAATIVATADPAQRIGTAHLAATSAGEPAVLALSLGTGAEASLVLSDDEARHETHAGIEALLWTLSGTAKPADAPATLTLKDVVALSGGRVPIGFSPSRHPGPFTADWSTRATTRIWLADGVLLDADGRSVTVVTLSGGGLQTPRTLTVEDGAGPGAPAAWRVSPDYRAAMTAALHKAAAARTEHRFWAVALPIALAIIGLLFALSAWRTSRRTSEIAVRQPTARPRADIPHAEGVVHAVH
jgi:high-affinity iron transporter